MKFFTTLTNLEGLPYDTKLRGEGSKNDYLLSLHSDYAAFVLNSSQDDYRNDGWIPVDFRNNVNVDLARNAAMATGAFPVGLRARKVTRDKVYLNDLFWHKKITARNPVEDQPHEALIVDGGVINNEPFIRVKEMLGMKGNAQSGEDSFTCTMVMIDPFPSEAPRFDVNTDDIFPVIGSTISAVLSQMRAKPEVLDQAQDENDFSQFLIAPRREIDGELEEGSKAIACGFLGGFGGFIHKEFRIHDYFLGRANCERFLREHFTVDINTSNPIFLEGYQNVDPSKHVSSDKSRRQIIPLFTEAKKEMYMPVFSGGSNWPKINGKEIDRLKKPLKRRAGKFIMNMASYSWLQRILIWVGNGVLIKGKVAKTVINVIKKSMDDYKLVIK